MDIITFPPHNQTETALAVAHGQQLEHKPLAEFITLALAACGSESENTRRTYTRSWGDFLAYAGDVLGVGALAIETKELRPDGKMNRTAWAYTGDTRIFEQITPSLRDGFNQVLINNGLAPSTRELRKNAVNTLLRVAYRDGYIGDLAAHRLGLEVYQKREHSYEQPVGRRLSKTEVRTLRETVSLRAKTDRKTTSDRALLDCMLFAGLRRSEVAALETGNLKQDGGRWWIVLESDQAKGGKMRRVKVHDTLYKSLEAWAEIAGLVIGEGDTPIFCNLAKNGKPTGHRLDASVIGRIVAEYGNAAGLAPATGENCLSPHDLRRTCARNAFDNGASLPQVQAMLGHSSVETTMRYIGAMIDDDRTAVDCVNYG